MTAPTRTRAASLFAGGEWLDADDHDIDVVNPADGEVIASVGTASTEQVGTAIAAAREAFDEGPWPSMSGSERARQLHAFGDALEARAEEIAELTVKEAGAIRRTVRQVHVETPMRQFRVWADAANRQRTRSLPHVVNPGPDGTSMLGGGVCIREPVGVVVAITPFNFPFYVDVLKLGPALATGNTVILKPSEFTPLIGLLMAEAAAEAGLPPGVLNVVVGERDAGVALTTDPRVDMISFTGSDAVGAIVMEQAARTLKRVVLEMGGKSAHIVCEDADLDAATNAGLMHLTHHAGQGCILCSRHLVHESIQDDYVALLAEKASRVTVGDPSDEATDMGPLIRERHRQRVERYVNGAIDDGFQLAFGGRRPEHCSSSGYFFEPTLFRGVDNGSPLAQDEIFGPVGAVISFGDDDDAVRLANDSRYGLSASVFSENTGRAFEIAQRLRTGEVNLNGGTGRNPWAPFGGYKRSGVGREFGEEGLDSYCELKSVNFRAR